MFSIALLSVDTFLYLVHYKFFFHMIFREIFTAVGYIFCIRNIFNVFVVVLWFLLRFLTNSKAVVSLSSKYIIFFFIFDVYIFLESCEPIYISEIKKLQIIPIYKS